MCGRFLLTSPGAVLAEQFSLSEPIDELAPRFNISPSQRVGTITEGAGQRHWQFRQWGLVPGWAKDPAIGNRLINARSETASEKPSFREALAKRRCIVPADGFYEWGKGSGTQRRPHWFRDEANALLAIAGLWERWHAPSGEILETCTLLTSDADDCVAPVHKRMPVLLGPQFYAAWLDADLKDPDEVLSEATRTHPRLARTPLGSHVNDPRNQGPECLAPPAPDLSLFPE